MHRVGVVGMVLAALLVAAPAKAAQLEDIRTPTEWVDEETVTFYGKDHPGEFRARVLLPDGYDGRREFPVLYLLHGMHEDYRTWSTVPEPGDAGEWAGDIERTAAGLDAIVVMPEGADGWYTDWWNGGRRGKPRFERFVLEDLVPLVERRYATRSGRRWRAIGGFSMGGFGAIRLAGARPDLFGAAVSISGALSLRGLMPDLPDPPGYPFRFDDAFGPRDGFYREGHDPVRLVDNLRSTRLYVTAGDGTPKPDDRAGPVDQAVGMMFEPYVRRMSEEWVAAARAAGIQHTWVADRGRHSYHYAREDLREAIAWKLFEPVPKKPTSWSYTTVAEEGRMWNLRFKFAEPPQTVITFRRDGDRLSGDGSGTVTLSGPGGRRTLSLPFDVRY